MSKKKAKAAGLKRGGHAHRLVERRRQRAGDSLEFDFYKPIPIQTPRAASKADNFITEDKDKQ